MGLVDWEDECSVNGGDGRVVTTEFGSLFQYITTLPEKADPSFGGGSNLGVLVGVPSKAASSGRVKKQVRINNQETREYLECGKVGEECQFPPLSLIFEFALNG